MKKFVSYSIEFNKKQIVVTKKFMKAASVIDTAEYTLMMSLVEKHPTFSVVERQINKAEGKHTYAKLTIDKMREFIEDYACKGDDARKASSIAELDKLLTFYEFHKSAKYGATKKWFFENFGDEYKAFANAEATAS